MRETKVYCDLCKAEIKPEDLEDFFCLMTIRYKKSILAFVKHQKQVQPETVEKHYEFCRKCLSDKLPGFDY